MLYLRFFRVSGRMEKDSDWSLYSRVCEFKKMSQMGKVEPYRSRLFDIRKRR